MKRIILVTGRSGAGKATTLQVLEDFGYYTIDNLPISLVPSVVDKLQQENEIEYLALGMDIRSFQYTNISIDSILDELDKYGDVEAIYLTCREDVLLNRYMSSRRPHPLSNKYEALTECIRAEEQLLYPIYRRSTMSIDTTNKNVHDLRQILSVKLGKNDKLVVILQSFGFKHGVPMDTDFLFDVRHLVNPHWVPELRPYVGTDKPVQDFLAMDETVNDLYQDIYHFLDKWLVAFSQGNRHFITISIGCTGGQHRSVYFVDRLSKDLENKWTVQTVHREMKHWS